MPEEQRKIKVHIKRTLTKFAGEYSPDKQPIEVTTEEFDEEIDDGTYECLQRLSGECGLRK